MTAVLLLVGVTAIWGWTFVLVKDAVSLYPTFPFLALRFALAAVVLLPLVSWRRLRVEVGPPAATGTPAPALAPCVKGGLVMGVLLTSGYVFQTLGLERTTASNAGFITGLFVVMVPPLEMLIWRRRVRSSAIVGVLLAATGLYLLSGVTRAVSLDGDLLVLVCAFSFSLHILATGRYAGKHDPLALTVVQLATVALIAAAITVGVGLAGKTSEPWRLPDRELVWWALGVTGVLASAVGFLVQTYAQRYVSPSRTAVILTMEPVFAGIFGLLLAGDRLRPLQVLGGVLILAGMLLSGRNSRRLASWARLPRGDEHERRYPSRS